jgi:hypothetical protein
MLRLPLIVSFVFFSWISPGQVLTTDLVIFSEKGERLTVFVNDEKVNVLPESNVKATGLSEGSQKIRIESEGKKLIEDSICIKAFEKNNRKEITYILKKGKKGYELDFISIGDLSGPKSPVIPEAPKYLASIVDTNVYGNLYRATTTRKAIFFDNYNDTTRTCRVSLEDKEIQYAINYVNKSNDFEDRYRFIENSIKNNCYTTLQLLELLKMLPMEMDKLKLTKEGYAHLKDQRNAIGLGEAFKYPAFKEDFHSFLKDETNSKKQLDLKCAAPLAELDFNVLLSSIKKIGNEYDRFKIAKKETILHCLSTKQLGEVLGCFTHDREKLELVRTLLNVVVDKEALPTLEKNFQFSENKGEFLKLITNAK